MGNIKKLKTFLATVLESQDCCSIREFSFKVKFHDLLFQHHVVHRLMYFQYENLHILM